MPPDRVLTCRRIHCKHVAGLGVNMSSEYAIYNYVKLL